MLQGFISVWVAIVVFTFPVWSEAAPLGERIFSANCSACHIGGTNVIISEKTLQQEALARYGMNSLDAIKTQVYSGKSAMPAFGGRLSDEEIEAVAQYVLQQAANGWENPKKTAEATSAVSN